MQKKSDKRTRVLQPAIISGFASRLRQLLASEKISQAEFAKEIGGFRTDTVGRLARSASTGIPLDLLSAMCGWARGKGYSVDWLVVGFGPVRSADIDRSAVQSPARILNELVSQRMLLALAKRAGIDVDDLLPEWIKAIELPGRGTMTATLFSGDEFEEFGGKVTPAEAPKGSPLDRQHVVAEPYVPGYRTVPAEDVPATKNWKRMYVPIAGRVGRKVASDWEELAQSPPSWAGEFLVYEGAPPLAVAIRVPGESLRPQYADGDVVIVDPHAPANPGEVCCVLVRWDDMREVRLKRLRMTKRGVILEPVNRDPKFKPQRIKLSEFDRAYKIVDHLPLLKSSEGG